LKIRLLNPSLPGSPKEIYLCLLVRKRRKDSHHCLRIQRLSPLLRSKSRERIKMRRWKKRNPKLSLRNVGETRLQELDIPMRTWVNDITNDFV
jgi:hypothetical protein